MLKLKNRKFLTFAKVMTVTLGVVQITSCKGVATSSRKKQTAPTTTETTTETTTASATGGLAISYPEGLSVANTTTAAPASSANDPTSVAFASGSLALPTSLTSTNLMVGDTAPTSYEPTEIAPRDRIINAAKRLKGESDDCLPAYIFNPAPVNAPACYNPDGDLARVYQDYTTNPPSNPRFQGGGLTLTNEACLAAYTRAKTAEVAAIVDQAQALVEGMICASYKKDKSQKIPDQNETLDLLPALIEATGATKLDTNADITSPTNAPTPIAGVPTKSMFRFMKAEIKREADTADRSKYISSIVMEVNGTVRDIKLVHMPSIASKNDDYIGRLSIRTRKVQFSGVTENHENFLDVNYMMDLDTAETGKARSRYRLLRAMFNHAALAAGGLDPFAGIGRLNVNIGANFTVATNDAAYGTLTTDVGHDSNYTISRVNQIEWDGNPLTFEGKFSFWVNPGGNYNEAARGLVASIQRESPDSTRLKGCAISGAALGAVNGPSLSIRKSQKDGVVLKPRGYYHPNGGQFAVDQRQTTRCQKGDCQFAPFVYKQCFRQNDAGIYVPEGNTDTTNNYDVINVANSSTSVDSLLPVVDGKIQSP